MNRLTRKENVDYTTNAIIHTVGFVVAGDRNRDYNNALKKLYDLENLEEQLGCPLEAREKALQQGYIYNGFTKLLYICCRYDENGCYLTNGAVKFYVSEYKKTWWLKKDKSE